MKKQIITRVEEEDYMRLQAMAKKLNRSVSNYLKTLLLESLKEGEVEV